MNYSQIRKYDVSNGCGVRVSVWFSGCSHHCNLCFNHELWDFNSGKEFTEEAKNELFTYLSDEHIRGLSILGGEPLQQGEELLDLLVEVREKFPTKDIWLWTGYYIDGRETLVDEQKKILSLCDYVVDGRFDIKQKKLGLKFRGSANQTIYHNENGKFVRSELND